MSLTQHKKDVRAYLARLSGQAPRDRWHKIRYCELPHLHFEVMCDINPARAWIVIDRGDWNDVTADGLEWLQKNILPYQEDWSGRPADSCDIDGIGGTVGAVCVNPEDALWVLKLLLPKEAFWLSQIRDDLLSEPIV